MKIVVVIQLFDRETESLVRREENWISVIQLQMYVFIFMNFCRILAVRQHMHTHKINTHTHTEWRQLYEKEAIFPKI